MWAIPITVHPISTYTKFTQFTKQESLGRIQLFAVCQYSCFENGRSVIKPCRSYLMLNQYDKAIADLNLYASQRFVYARSQLSSRYYDSKELCIQRDRYSISIKPNLLILITVSISTIRQTLGVI